MTDPQPGSRSPAPSTSPRPGSPTPGATPAPLSRDHLEFVAAVVRHPDAGAPGRVRASLTNHAGRTLVLAGGDPLPVGGNAVDAERVDAAAPLVLLPQRADRANEYRFRDGSGPVTVEDAVREGCWRLPGEVVRTAAGQRARLPPGTTVAADFFPLGRPDAACPRGTYEAKGEVVLTDGDGRGVGVVGTTLQVALGDASRLSVRGSLTLERV